MDSGLAGVIITTVTVTNPIFFHPPALLAPVPTVNHAPDVPKPLRQNAT
jgi:hypothetical protein